MAPDSSLQGHHAAGSEAGFRKCFVKAAALLLLSLFVFNFQAQAGAEGTEIPGGLAALSLPGDLPKNDISIVPLTQPTPTDVLTGTPAVSWRNGIQIPINEPLIQKYIRFYRGEGRATFSAAMEKAEKLSPPNDRDSRKPGRTGGNGLHCVCGEPFREDRVISRSGWLLADDGGNSQENGITCRSFGGRKARSDQVDQGSRQIPENTLRTVRLMVVGPCRLQCGKQAD